MESAPLNFVVLCDFDGTILTIDTSVFLLERFAQEDWRIYDEQLERKEITLEECLRKQFSTVKATKAEILKEVQKAYSTRAGFKKLVEYCKTHEIGFIIVSAGLDFVIEHFLRNERLLQSVEICAPKAKPTTSGVELTFPKMRYDTSVSFKDDMVRFHQNRGFKVIYIGDGFADYKAAKDADISFAVRGSKLAEILKNNGIPHKEINDFLEIIDALDSANSSKWRTYVQL